MLVEYPGITEMAWPARSCAAGGMMWADFSAKQASGVFALVNYVNQLRTGPNR